MVVVLFWSVSVAKYVPQMYLNMMSAIVEAPTVNTFV